MKGAVDRVEISDAAIQEADAEEDQERAFAEVQLWVRRYRVVREEVKTRKDYMDVAKIPILKYVQKYGGFVLDGLKSQMKTRRGNISYDREALDAITAAWMEGDEIEQKCAKIILNNRIEKSSTTYLEVK